MFYEENIINGVLCFRTSPHGMYKALSQSMLQERYLKALKDLAKAEAIIATLSKECSPLMEGE